MASQIVGPVMKEVFELWGKVPNQLPSSPTVDVIVDRKLWIAQKHISQLLQNKNYTTLYTVETRKYGKTMQDEL